MSRRTAKQKAEFSSFFFVYITVFVSPLAYKELALEMKRLPLLPDILSDSACFYHPHKTYPTTIGTAW